MTTIRSSVYQATKIVEPTLADAAFAAGFFDGEGCITIQAVNQKRDWYIQVTVGQRTLPVLSWLQDRWDGSTCQRTSGLYTWSLTRAWRVQQFFEDIRPFAIVKAAEIAYVLEALQANRALTLADHDYLQLLKRGTCVQN